SRLDSDRWRRCRSSVGGQPRATIGVETVRTATLVHQLTPAADNHPRSFPVATANLAIAVRQFQATARYRAVRGPTCHRIGEWLSVGCGEVREEKWVILQADREDGPPLMAVAARPLRAAHWPRFDTHVGVELPYVDRGNGLPTNASLDQLRAAEDD